MSFVEPVKAREFATSTVKQLRASGFEALWAGGCVRDMLMKREPKDYDVATNARPEQIREVFGLHRTLAIGASFGVIILIGPSGSGQIDIATFRRDAEYSDGRHPDSVTFCNAEEDARRRDFTINGLFYDPIDGQVIDYVDGQTDLKNQIIRAIGKPSARFQEDKLRVLRAVRFASTLGFEIEPITRSAVREFAPQIWAVSAERITEEMKKMLVHQNRRRGLELLWSTQLLMLILPQWPAALVSRTNAELQTAWECTLQISQRIHSMSVAPSFAALWREINLARNNDLSVVDEVGRRWRISNDEAQAIRFCLEQEVLLRSAPHAPWPKLQRVLIDPRIDMALCYAEAVAHVVDASTAGIDFCRQRLAWPPETLNPRPLVGGHELLAAGIPKGPIYKQLLDAVRDAQLLGEVATPEEALAWIASQWAARKQA